MTPEEEKTVDQLVEMVSSLANLTQTQANLLETLSRQNMQLVSRIQALEAIWRAQK
jgi:DNA-binding response OmpR family regulator